MNRFLTLTLAALCAAGCLAQDDAGQSDATDETARQWNTVVLRVDGMT